MFLTGVVDLLRGNSYVGGFIYLNPVFELGLIIFTHNRLFQLDEISQSESWRISGPRSNVNSRKDTQ